MSRNNVIPIDDALHRKLAPLIRVRGKKELAAETGLTRTTLWKIERRECPTLRLSNLKKLAEALGLTLEELGIQEHIEELRGAMTVTIAKLKKLFGKWGLSRPDYAKVSILELYRLHNSSEAKKLRKYIRDDLQPYMAGFREGDLPLDARQDEKSTALLDKFESVLNYFEMLGAFMRFGVVPREILLDMVHNSCTKLWSVITQTEEHDASRFVESHVERQLAKIRSRKKRGEDYAGDVAFLALCVRDFRDEELHLAGRKPRTGGEENRR